MQLVGEHLVTKQSPCVQQRTADSLGMQQLWVCSCAFIRLKSSPPNPPGLHRHNMGAASTLLLGALCQALLYVSAYAAGEASPVLGCKASNLLTGDLCIVSFEAHGLMVERAREETERGSLRLKEICSMLRRPKRPPGGTFRAKLSDPTALRTHFSYHYSASLIVDGLANGTDPVYVYTMPAYDSQLAMRLACCACETRLWCWLQGSHGT